MSSPELERLREIAGENGRIITDATRRQLVNGRQFIIDPPAHVAAIFGRGQEVVWAQGESLLVNGPTGVGKGTLMQQVALRRAAVLTGDLLGYPVLPDPDRLTLYLAMDRPAQITRSFKRMVTSDQAEQLEQRLHVWKGPLPFDLVKHPELLAEFIVEIGEVAGKTVGTVFADSLKDMASKIASEESGDAINRAFALVLAAEIELAASHHQRKATSENKKPTKIDDVYGSTWITAGAGSVIGLWGEPGAPVVELSHLKQPAEDIGPFEIEHDHVHGVSTRVEKVDAWIALQHATGGLTVADAATQIHGSKPSRAQIQKARRKLDRFVTEKHAVRIEPTGSFKDVIYKPTLKHSVTTRDDARDDARPRHAPSRNPENTRHAPVTPPNNAPPYEVGGGERDVHDQQQTAIDEPPAPLSAEDPAAASDRPIVGQLLAEVGV